MSDCANCETFEAEFDLYCENCYHGFCDSCGFIKEDTTEYNSKLKICESCKIGFYS